MKRVIISTILFAVIFLCSFQCNDKLIRLAANTQVRVFPNPVVVSENKVSFRYEVALPSQNDFSKADSIQFQFLTKSGGHTQYLDKSIYVPKKEEKKLISIFQSGHIEKEMNMLADTVPLHFAMTIYRKGKSRQSPSLIVGTIVRGNER